MRRALEILLLAACLTGIPASDAGAGPRTHLVRPGETLYRIALLYQVTVDALARANGLVDPSRIRAGQLLTIPVLHRPTPDGPALEAAARTFRGYTVRRGDTLFSIARRHGTTVTMLMQVNGLQSDRIRAGQLLRVPPAAAAASGDRGRPAAAGPIVSDAVPEIGAEVPAPRPLRVRRGPRSYLTTAAIAAQGTDLRILGRDEAWVQVRLPDGTEGWVAAPDLRVAESGEQGGRRSAAARPDASRADLVREAFRYLGTPYVWGGESSRGVDCSGFVYVVLSARMPQLARLRSFDYFQMGMPVDRANLQPGDLVFFTTYAPGASHVGLYAGGGRFLHASSGARRVLATPLDDPYYAARYVGARRLLPP